jgi:hypothetical protein
MLTWSQRTSQAQARTRSQTGARNRLPIILVSGHMHATRSPVPLDLASIPKHAQHIKKLPLHNPTLSSLKAPATEDALPTLSSPEASSPSVCQSFIARLTKRPKLSMGKRYHVARLFFGIKFEWKHNMTN